MSVARTRLQENFSRAAATYDAAADLQHHQTARVLDAALMLLPTHATVLDVGCGTGYFAALAVPHRPAWRIVGADIAYGMCAHAATRCSPVQADAATLPFADASLDAVVSSLCLQWVADKPRACAEMQRVLKPGGLAVVATLGESTLRELRLAAGQAQLTLGLLPMVSADGYRAAVAASGLDVHLWDRSAQVSHYPNVAALLNSMRRIGAGNHVADDNRAMMGAEKFRRMCVYYETLRNAEGIPATWEHVFMVLRKPQ